MLDRKAGFAHSEVMAPHDPVFVTVEVRALVVDPTTEAPVVILQTTEGSDLLPIWVGRFEAQSIAMAIEGVEAPRPLTHDLLKSVIQSTGFEVVNVKIHSLEDGIFKASAQLMDSGSPSKRLDIDARPSDAIALALRTQSPIQVSQTVLDLARIEKQSVDEALQTLLEQLGPDDLGQYEM